MQAEAKARKQLDKLVTKEAKYAKGLARAQEKHDKVVADLNKAKQDLDAKTQAHTRLVADRDPKQHELNKARALKEEHDVRFSRPAFPAEFTLLTRQICRLPARLVSRPTRSVLLEALLLTKGTSSADIAYLAILRYP